ncbi:uncharacterized protein LOC113505441 isoform X1 [Trichoplusia ni]|uniref:Uncharacterized protein LOC113505441 isoform X1 n=1 Tax=Trichoplusia ni TaxID=7111 RepID=A0A7E5WT00_TRINI|nr:uncharacterized protein LOC113505441 isoform X1 [Trichoplusia ni]
MPSCSIKQCGARKNKNHPGLTLHKFPANESLKQKWMQYIGSENINPKHKQWNVCSLHFGESCFNKTLDVMRLRDGAVPTLNVMPRKITSPQSTSSIVESGTNKTTSDCIAQTDTDTASPAQSDDSSREDTQHEEAINPSRGIEPCTTFAKAWTPIRESRASSPTSAHSNKDYPASMTINRENNLKSQAATEGKPLAVEKREQYCESITIKRLENKIEKLMKQCQLLKMNAKCWRERARRRDKKIDKLTFIIKTLRGDIRFNKEGSIILEKSEISNNLIDFSTLTGEKRSVSISNKVKPSLRNRKTPVSRKACGIVNRSNSSVLNQSLRTEDISMVTEQIGLSQDGKIRGTVRCTTSSVFNNKSNILQRRLVSLKGSSNQRRAVSNRITTRTHVLAPRPKGGGPPVTTSTPEHLPFSAISTKSQGNHNTNDKSNNLMLVVSPLNINRPKLQNNNKLIIERQKYKENIIKPNKILNDVVSPSIEDKPVAQKNKNSVLITEVYTPKDPDHANTTLQSDVILPSHESTDVIEETPLEMVLKKSDETNQNKFIYIIEVD